VILILALLIIVGVLVAVVPAVAAGVARNVVQSMDRSPASGSIDQSLVEARLGRIEEAIDAMALQIERLSEHQRALLGPEVSLRDDADPQRLERPD
jgi:predicted PurR-regulated permease PerM